MADNPQPPKASPPLPSSGMTARAPTTKLPPVQASRPGKIVVMLSSVAKAPPASTQQLPVVPTPFISPPKVVSPATPRAVQPPPLPAKQVKTAPAFSPPPASITTYVTLPPKTADPAFMSLTPRSAIGAEKKEPAQAAPPLLPAKSSAPVKAESKTPEAAAPGQAPPLGPGQGKAEMKKTGPIVLNQKPLAPPTSAKAEMRKTGLIKINPPAPEVQEPEESIFAEIPPPAPVPKPEGWKKLETGELPVPKAGLKSLDVFEHSQRLQPKPPPIPPVPYAKPSVTPPPTPTPREPQPSLIEAKSKPAAAPPMVSPRPDDPLAPGEMAGPALNPAPVVLPSVHPLNLAPPMVTKAHEEPKEKLPPPVLPEPARVAPTDIAPPVVAKAPALVEPDKNSAKAPALPPPLPVPKAKDKDKLRKTAPIVLTHTSRVFLPGASEAKPLLRPAVLPRRSTLPPAEPPVEPVTPAPESKPPPDKAPAPAPAKTEAPAAKVAAAPREPSAVAKPEAAEPVKVSAKEESKPSLPLRVPAAAVGAGVAAAALTPSKKPFLPPTRAERAKKRRIREVVFFWILALLTTAALYFGILHFGRDTRVEGQVIPPEGMTLSDEVWIVSDFSSLASGVADDLAKERVPLQQEIQEAQDHVQRVQADIASREERIRLIQADVQATKDEINNLVKKSKDEAQALYDGEGKEIEDEYNDKLAALKQTIADRAASLKLPYAPDPNFPSPEVWANAYRLALYQVPPGVDGVKEHKWLADQMKQWRDFEKSLDDRNEQLREKAAQLKLEPAPRLADLNAKIEDLDQRIAATQAEEEPLKAELTQAQGDLSAAQNAEATLDDKYYGQLYSLPSENISYHIPVKPNGRFTWVPDNPFGEGEVRHLYWIFARATRADGRQYWALQQFPMEKNTTTEMTIEPGGFESTKAILRPNLTPEEQAQ